ncbi:MAG: hypothetical protein VX938_12305, partial [Myxococcota bacterium]|nr:hypothetical protein [Myxococcota bacterium]
MKSLLNGLSGGLPVEVEEEEIHEETVDPPIAQSSPRAEPPGEEKTGLAQVEAAMAGGEELRALTVVRGLLLKGQLAPSTLEVTGRLMNRLGEGDLADLFSRASKEQGAEALLELAGTFLRMGDSSMALSMARGAGRRTAADLTVVHGLIAESHARCGDHEAVLDLLGRYGSAWPDPALYRRFATSAVLAGDLSDWGTVQEDIRRDGESDWLLRAAERVATYGAGESSSHRTAYFALSGGCLVLDGPPVSDRVVSVPELRQIMHGVRSVLRESSVSYERVAYVSPRGEVFAHWLGELLDVLPIPLSGRIDGQST